MIFRDRYMLGNSEEIDRFTQDWTEVKIYEGTFYNDNAFDEYVTVLDTTYGRYTDLDKPTGPSVRFELEEDATTFKLAYSGCV